MQFAERDTRNLQRLRDYSRQTLERLEVQAGSSVLEIRPNRLVGAKNSPVFDEFPESFFDFRDRSVAESFFYSDLDLDPAVAATFTGDISAEVSPLPSNKFDLVICISVLEHVPNLEGAISNIHRALKENGTVLFITPWDLRFHGPRPDCWRISDDGYRHLLSKRFETPLIEYLEAEDRPLSPVALKVVATKS
jgi:SAM-dependent methyltransferase